MNQDEIKSRLKDGPLAFDRSLPLGDRAVSAIVIRELALDGLPVNLEGARIDGDLELGGEHLRAPLILRDCIIERVHLQYAVAENIIWFDKSTILGECLFRGARVNSDVSLQDVTFHGGLNVADVTITLTLGLSGAIVLSPSGLLGAGLNVGRNLLLTDHAFVECDVNFQGASIGGQLEIRDTTAKQNVNLTDARVGGTVVFVNSTILGNVNAHRMRCGGQLTIQSRVAIGEGLGLSGLRCDAQCYIGDAEITGDVDISGSSVARDLIFERVITHGIVNCSSAQVGGAIVIRSAMFSKDTWFQDVECGASLTIEGSTFCATTWFERTIVAANLYISSAMQDPGKPAVITSFAQNVYFNGTSVNGQARFEDVTFGSAAAFEALTVLGHMFCSSAFMENASFQFLSVKGKTSFSHSTALKNMLLGQITVGELDLASIKVFNDITLESARIRGDFKVSAASIGGTMQARNLHVGGAVVLQGTAIDNDVVFSGGELGGDLRLGDTTIRKMLDCNHLRSSGFVIDAPDGEPAATTFDGIDLRRAIIRDFRIDWNNVLSKQKPFDRQPYRAVEISFRNAGWGSDADNVYIAMQDRYGATLGAARRAWRAVWRGTSGYGAKATWPFWWFLSLAIVAYLLITTSTGLAAHKTSGTAVPLICQQPNYYDALNLTYHAVFPIPDESDASWKLGGAACEWTLNWGPVHPILPAVVPLLVLWFIKLIALFLTWHIFATVTGFIRYTEGRKAG